MLSFFTARIGTTFLPFIGIYIAGTLTISHVLGRSVPCFHSNGCNLLAYSRFSHVFGLPIAAIGLSAYLLLLFLACYQQGGGRRSQAALGLGYGISAFASCASLYLTGAGVLVLGESCAWCLGSALVFSLLLLCYTTVARESELRSPIRRREWTAIIFGGAVVAGMLWVTLRNSYAGSPMLNTRTLASIPANEIVGPSPHSLGRPNCPIKVVIFADFGCGMCKVATARLIQLANAGKIDLIYRHCLLEKGGAGMTAAAISEIAADRGDFWKICSSLEGLDHFDNGELLNVR